MSATPIHDPGTAAGRKQAQLAREGHFMHIGVCKPKTKPECFKIIWHENKERKTLSDLLWADVVKKYKREKWPLLRKTTAVTGTCEFQKRFKALWSLYRKKLPADLEHAIETYPKVKKWLQTYPRVALTWMELKIPMFRDAFVDVLKKASTNDRKALKRDEIRLIHTLLYRMVEALDGEITSEKWKWWQKNGNSGVHRHHGPLRFLENRKVIVEKKAHLAGEEEVSLCGKAYVLCPFKQRKESGKQHKESGYLTLESSQWLKEGLKSWADVDAFKASFESVNGALTRERAPYRDKWLFRTALACLLGKRRLDIKRYDATSFGNLFPDQKNLLLKVLPDKNNIEDKMKYLQYTGPVHLFTMYLCLFDGKWCRKHAAGEIDKKKTQIKNLLQSEREEWKYWLIPDQAILRVFKEQDDEEV